MKYFLLTLTGIKIFTTTKSKTYFMRVIRMVMLKGSNFADIRQEFIASTVYAVSLIRLSSLRHIIRV